MQIKTALQLAIDKLKDTQVDPVADSRHLLSHVLDKDKSYVLAFGEKELTPDQQKIFFEYIDKRIVNTPIQYIIGFTEFMGLTFKVNGSTLIPRHDTEILVERIIEICQNSQHKICSILDIGTGSGCIALSLAHYLPNTKVTAVDISKDALSVCKSNRDSLGLTDKVTLIESDIFSNVPPTKFDIIVSNPPYIPAEDIEGLHPQVKSYEPSTALTDGGDGLSFYRRIANESVNYLSSGGILAFEVGIGQSNHVSDMLRKNFRNVEIVKDLAGIERVVIGCLK